MAPLCDAKWCAYRKHVGNARPVSSIPAEKKQNKKTKIRENRDMIK